MFFTRSIKLVSHDSSFSKYLAVVVHKFLEKRKIHHNNLKKKKKQNI